MCFDSKKKKTKTNYNKKVIFLLFIDAAVEYCRQHNLWLYAINNTGGRRGTQVRNKLKFVVYQDKKVNRFT